MATISKRGPNRWRAQVRRKGAPQRPKTFERKEDARRWADKVEGAIASDDFVDLSEAERTTLGEVLERYLAEITPTKKGAKHEADAMRILSELDARIVAADPRLTDIADLIGQATRVAIGEGPGGARLNTLPLGIEDMLQRTGIVLRKLSASSTRRRGATP